MARNFLVLQHAPWEGPGSFFHRVADEEGIRLDIVRVWAEPLPDLAPFDGLIVLGGPPNVDQEEQYPFLREEKQLIRRSLAEDRPYLGFCLGHQLLAAILGAEVGANFAPSIGFVEGYLTSDGRRHPAFRELPAKLRLFKWHAQAVLQPLPASLTVLATSRDCQVEAICAKDRPHLLGLQFDNQAAAPEDVKSWLDADRSWLASLPGPAVEPRVVMDQAREYGPLMEDEFRVFFSSYLKSLS